MTPRAAADFVLRLSFFAAAPFALVFIAQLFPVTGAIVQIVISLLVFFAAETIRKQAARLERVTITERLLSDQFAFEAYYREHPPRPFLYYVFYPLLFPYWLSVPRARREFLLFKGYTLVSFGLLLVSLAWQYYKLFPPELGLREFGPIAAGTLLAEVIVVLTFLMPLVTSVVDLHQRGARRRLFALFAVGLLSMGFASYRVERRRDPIVSFAARRRVQLRAAAKPNALWHAEVDALRAAWKVLPKERDDIESDGKVIGDPLDRAHEGLQHFFKPDEAYAFDLWYSRRKHQKLLVVYFQARFGHDPIWLAMDRAGKITHEIAQLPRGAFAAMRRATQ